MAARVTARIRRQHGFSLPELMMAMMLGLGIVATALTGWAQGRTALRAREERAQLLDQARAALAFIGTDLEMAGYYGLRNSAAPFRFMQAGETASALPAAQLSQDAAAITALDAAAQACGANYAIDVGVAVQASDASFTTGSGATTACAAHGAAQPGSDTLTVRRAITSNATASAGRVQLLTDRSDDSLQLLFADGVLPVTATLQPGVRELHDLQTRIYYVSQDSDGQAGLPALRMKTLSAIAGTPAFIDTEVMPGIEDLQVQLLLDGGWVQAQRPPANQPVRAVRVSLTARAQEAAAAAPTRAQWSATFRLRNAP